jgi:MFS-type transporter involved in bile tolerance (Atg22 family)
MGATGFIFSMSMGKIIERFDTKKVLLVGMLMMIAAPIPSSLIKEGDVSL